VDVALGIAEGVGEPAPTALAAPPDGMAVAREAGGRLHLATDLLDLTVDPRRRPARWRVTFRGNGHPDDARRAHLALAAHRLLLAAGRVHVHAAAVRWAGRVHLFVGDRGAGKSTISLWLAMRGGLVLSDDHVLLRRAGGRFWVSGCEETSRVTAATEAFLFPRPLAIPATDFGGSLKKEFRLADVVPSAPYRDFPVHHLFFARVGTRFRVTPMRRQQAVLELIEKTRRSFRFADGTDQREFVDYWIGLAEGTPAFALELAPDLRQLDRLLPVLQR
jgi:hypothetical protein